MDGGAAALGDVAAVDPEAGVARDLAADPATAAPNLGPVLALVLAPPQSLGLPEDLGLNRSRPPCQDHVLDPDRDPESRLHLQKENLSPDLHQRAPPNLPKRKEQFRPRIMTQIHQIKEKSTQWTLE